MGIAAPVRRLLSALQILGTPLQQDLALHLPVIAKVRVVMAVGALETLGSIVIVGASTQPGAAVLGESTSARGAHAISGLGVTGLVSSGNGAVLLRAKRDGRHGNAHGEDGESLEELHFALFVF